MYSSSFKGFNGNLELFTNITKNNIEAMNNRPAVLVLLPNLKAVNVGQEIDEEVTVRHPFIKQILKLLVDQGFFVTTYHYHGVGNSSMSSNPTPDDELINSSFMINSIGGTVNLDQLWVIGIGVGAHLAIQLISRRHEITHFIALNPTIQMPEVMKLDICSAKGLFLTSDSNKKLIQIINKAKSKLSLEKNNIKQHIITGTNDLYEGKEGEVINIMSDFIAKETDPDNR